MNDREKFRNKCDKVCEAIKDLIDDSYEVTWKQKAEMLEESSSDLDGHSSMEEFLNWGEEFLPK